MNWTTEHPLTEGCYWQQRDIEDKQLCRLRHHFGAHGRSWQQHYHPPWESGV